jgi:hypothetical protein
MTRTFLLSLTAIAVLLPCAAQAACPDGLVPDPTMPSYCVIPSVAQSESPNPPVALPTVIAAKAPSAKLPVPIDKSSPYYASGQADRAKWEAWLASQAGDAHEGAAYWSAQRSITRPGSCEPPGTTKDWQAGCVAARVQLALPDALRRSEPDYKAGWNSPVTSTAPQAPPDQATPSAATDSETPGQATVVPEVSDQDPYANDYSKSLKSTYEALRSSILDEVKTLYFAVGCKVFPSEMYVIQLVNDKSEYLIQEAVSNQIDFRQNPDLIRKAASNGMSLASQPGACDYWHQHPDAVFDIRQEAGSASGINNPQ